MENVIQTYGICESINSRSSIHKIIIFLFQLHLKFVIIRSDSHINVLNKNDVK